MNTIDDLVASIVNEPACQGKSYIYSILGTSNSLTSGYFKIIEGEVSYELIT